MRDSAERIFGPEIANGLEDFWGVDAEGEIIGAWKRQGCKYILFVFLLPPESDQSTKTPAYGIMAAPLYTRAISPAF